MSSVSDFRIEGIVDVDVSPFIRGMQSARKQIIETGKEIGWLSDDIDRLGAKSASIKVSVETGSTLEDLSIIKEMANDLDHKIVDIKAKVEGVEKVTAELAAVDKEAKALDGKDVDLKVKVDGAAKATAELGALNGVSEALGGSLSGGLIPALVVLASALMPIAGVALGASMGLVGLLGVAGAGVASFAAFAIPAFKSVATAVTSLSAAQKRVDTATTTTQLNAALAHQQQIIKGLNPVIADMVVKFDSLKTEYQKLTKQMEPQIFSIASKGLDALHQMMILTAPVARVVGTALGHVMDNINTGLKGDSWTGFFSYLKDNAGPIIETLMSGFGNFLTGINNLIVAFDPLTKQVNTGFLGMSESFLKWSKDLGGSNGFKIFVDWMKINGPIIWQDMKDIVSAVWNLAVAFEPLGTKILAVADSLVNFLGNLAKVNPQLASFLLVAGAAAIALGPLVLALFKMNSVTGPLKLVGAAITGFLGPIGLAVVAIAGIGIIMAVVSDKTASYKSMMSSIGGVFTTIKNLGIAFWNMLKDVYTTLLENGSIDRFQQGIQSISDAIGALMPFLGPVISLIGVGLKGALTVVSILFEGAAWVIKAFAAAIGLVIGGIGTVMIAMSHVPGLGWMKAAGQDLLDASDNARKLADNIGGIKSPEPVKVEVSAPGLPGVINDMNTIGKPQYPLVVPDSSAVQPVQNAVNNLGLTQYPLIKPDLTPLEAAVNSMKPLGEGRYPLITPVDGGIKPMKSALTGLALPQNPLVTPQGPTIPAVQYALNNFSTSQYPLVDPKTPNFHAVQLALNQMDAPKLPKITPVVYGSLAEQALTYLTRERSVYVTTFMKTLNLPTPGGPRPPGSANGGPIFGSGTGVSDSIHAMLSNGEYVINASQTAKNRKLLDAINSGTNGFADGGMVSPLGHNTPTLSGSNMGIGSRPTEQQKPIDLTIKIQDPFTGEFYEEKIKGVVDGQIAVLTRKIGAR